MTLEDTLRQIVREEIARAIEPLTRPRVEAEVLDSEDAAAMLAIPVDSLRKKAARGEVPSFKVGSLLRFRVSELRAWLDERKR